MSAAPNPKPSNSPTAVPAIDGSGTIGSMIAVVDGRGAFILAKILTGFLCNRLTLRRLLADMRLDPTSEAAAVEAFLALEEAGEGWRRSRLPRRGNAETRGNEEPLASEVMVSSADASRLLGVSQRRVTQLALAGDLPGGAKTARGWLFPRAEVVGLCERRRAGES